MNELRAWSEKRTLIDYDQISGDFGQMVIVCVDKAVLAICAKYIAQRGKWKSSYLKAIANDRQYYTIDDVELNNVHNHIDQFLDTYGGVEQMNCDIVSALEAIAGSLGAAGCGCGAGGGPSASPPLETDEFGDPLAETGTPPDGYATWQDYQQRKCDIASWIVTNLKNDLVYLQAGDIASITVGALAIGLLALLSAGTLAVIVGVLAAIAAYGASILADGYDAVVDNFDDLVCALWSAESAADSISDYNAAIDAAIDAATADTLARVLLKTLLHLWADSASVNLMYQSSDVVEARQIPTGGDCSSCGLDCSTHFVDFGEKLSGDEYASEFDGQGYRLSIIFNSTSALSDCSGSCGPEQQFKLTGLVGFTDAGGSADNFRIWADSDCPHSGTNASVYSSDTQPPTTTSYCGRRLVIISTTDFTATVVEEGVC